MPEKIHLTGGAVPCPYPFLPNLWGKTHKTVTFQSLTVFAHAIQYIWYQWAVWYYGTHLTRMIASSNASRYIDWYKSQPNPPEGSCQMTINTHIPFKPLFVENGSNWERKDIICVCEGGGGQNNRDICEKSYSMIGLRGYEVVCWCQGGNKIKAGEAEYYVSTGFP